MVLHVIGLASTGRVFHAIRNWYLKDPWTPWDDLTFKVGDPSSPLLTLKCATVARSLHLCGTTVGGRIVHTVRDPTGTWQPFWGDVGAAAGLRNNRPDFVAATAATGDLHVFATVQPPPTGGGLRASDYSVRHAIRSTSPPGWPQAFTIIDSGLSGVQLVLFTELAAASVEDVPHVCVLGLDNQLWHTVRTAVSPAAWQPFNDVRLVHANKIGYIGLVAMAGIGPLLHVCVLADGTIWHTIRTRTRWQPEWGDVRKVMSPLSNEAVTQVACASVDNNLHVTALTADGRIIHTIRMTNPPSWQNPEGSSRAEFGDVTAVVGALSVYKPGPFVSVATSGDS